MTPRPWVPGLKRLTANEKKKEFVFQDGSTLLKIVMLFGCFIPAVNNTANGETSDFT